MRASEFLPEVGDKMSRINLDQSLVNTPPAWKKFISLLPPQLAREFVDERPVPNQEDIDWFTPLRLTNPQPVTVSVADLLKHPENQGTIGRSPDDVITAVNQQWGLKIPSGKKYDPNPARYRAYAQMTSGTASPSVAVDGVIIFGAGRFVAAALRGDKTMRVWSMARKQGVAEGSLNEFAPDNSGGDSGRWYTDDELADIIGDDWFEDFDVSHNGFNIDAYGEKAKQNLVDYANSWFDDRGYSVNVMGVEHNDVDHDLKWYIVGSFYNPGFANKGVAEGGAETSWSNDTDTITLQDILELTKHIKQINLPINDNLKSKLLHWEGNPEEIERVNQVTVSNQFPILIMVDEQGQIAWILDGNHRLHKAIQSQAKTIPAKLIRPSNLDDKAKKIFNIKEQGVAEDKLG